MELEQTSSIPLYQQIKTVIRKKIENDDWPPGQRLPSDHTLVEDLGVSRMTIHRALRELTAEGLINRVHGLGTFVTTPPRHASLIRLQDIAEEVRNSGGDYSCRVLQQKMILAKGEVAADLGVEPGASLCYLRMVHMQNRTPIQVEDRVIHPDYFTDFMSADFTCRTATDFLINRLKPDEMEHVVRAILPDKRTAGSLLIDSTEPCIQLTRRTWKNNRIVTRVILTYPGSRYDLQERYRTEQFPTST